MTNKEKALTLIAWDRFETLTERAVDAIELAAKPDWYYPSKGEFPKLMKDFVTNLGTVYYWDGEFLHLDGYMTDITIMGIKAWTYLPKFEE